MPGFHDRHVQTSHWRQFKAYFAMPFFYVLALWSIKFYQLAFDWDLSFLGVYPLKWQSLPAIATQHLVHKDWSHLYSNSLPLIVLGILLFYLYDEIKWQVLLIIMAIGGSMVWLWARPAYHIGASSIVYGLICFTFFSGLFRRDKQSIALSLLVTFLYGGMVWGVLPISKEISWESHLFYSIGGFIAAFVFRKRYLTAFSQSMEADLDNYQEFEDDDWKEDDSNYADFDYGLDNYHTTTPEMHWSNIREKTESEINDEYEPPKGTIQEKDDEKLKRPDNLIFFPTKYRASLDDNQLRRFWRRIWPFR